MNFQEKLLDLSRAAGIAVLCVGILGTGLGLATWSVEKANALVFSTPVVESTITHPANCTLE